MYLSLGHLGIFTLFVLCLYWNKMYRTLPLHLLGAAGGEMDGWTLEGAACVELPLGLQPFLTCSLRCKSENEGFQVKLCLTGDSSPFLHITELWNSRTCQNEPGFSSGPFPAVMGCSPVPVTSLPQVLCGSSCSKSASGAEETKGMLHFPAVSVLCPSEPRGKPECKRGDAVLHRCTAGLTEIA